MVRTSTCAVLLCALALSVAAAAKLGVEGACKTAQSDWCPFFQVCSVPLRRKMEHRCCKWCASQPSCAPFAFCHGALAQVVHGHWGAWGACTKRCDWGVQIRECDNPAPRGGGAYCDGAATRDCNAHKCRAGDLAAGGGDAFTDEGMAGHRCRDAPRGKMKLRCKLLKRALRLPDEVKRAQVQRRFCRPGRPEFLACPKSCRRCRRHKKGVHGHGGGLAPAPAAAGTTATTTAAAAAAVAATTTTSTTSTTSTTTTTARPACSDAPDSGCDGLRQALATFGTGAARSGSFVEDRYCAPGTKSAAQCAKACCAQPACAADPCTARGQGGAQPTTRPPAGTNEDADEDASPSARHHDTHHSQGKQRSSSSSSSSRHHEASWTRQDAGLPVDETWEDAGLPLHGHGTNADDDLGDDDDADRAMRKMPATTTTTTTTTSTTTATGAAAAAAAMAAADSAAGEAYARFQRATKKAAVARLRKVKDEIAADLDDTEHGAGHGAMPGEGLDAPRRCGPWRGARPCPKHARGAQQQQPQQQPARPPAQSSTVAPTPAPPTPPPTQPGEGGWGLWTACALGYGVVAAPGATARDRARLSCGRAGRQTRTCDRPPPKSSPYFVGLGCVKRSGVRTQPADAVAAEQRACQTAPCPVDGAWGSWSACAPACGERRFLTRACDSPAPSRGGFECFGADRKACAQGPPCAAAATTAAATATGAAPPTAPAGGASAQGGDDDDDGHKQGARARAPTTKKAARARALHLAALKAARKYKEAAEAVHRATVARRAQWKAEAAHRAAAAAAAATTAAPQSDDDFESYMARNEPPVTPAEREAWATKEDAQEQADAKRRAATQMLYAFTHPDPARKGGGM